MNEDQIVTQMGLLLTQLGAMRRAVEDIARATSRYAGFAFAEAFTPGAGFGAPPMRGGALLVYVSNISDLVSGGGVAGFFEGLLGGIGRFFGGLFGGLIGGTIGGVLLPVMIAQVDSIVGNIRDILDRLGIRGGAPARPAAQPSTPQAAVTERPLSEQLGEFRDILSLATGLFEAAGSGGTPAPERMQMSLTPAGERWLAMLRSVEAIVAGVARVINGLILLVPILLGSLALLIQRLDAIKLAVIEMLQFVLRNAMLLRGVVLVTVFDLLASAARLAAGLVNVVSETVRGVLAGLFGLAGTVLQGALAAFQFLAGGLQRTINGMLRWLVDTLFVVLARLGDLRIFRLITHLIQVMPAVLPPLYALLKDKGAPPLTPTQIGALNVAAALPIPNAAFTSSTLPSSLLPTMPDASQLAAPQAARDELLRQLNVTREGLAAGVTQTFGALQQGFTGLGDRFAAATRDELARGRTEYGGHLQSVRENSARFAEAFSAAETAARARPQTGLEAIAGAYEQWLSGGGLATVLGQITRQFQQTPSTATGSIPGRIVAETPDRPRASIEIEEVVIDVTPPEPGSTEAGGLTEAQADALFELFLHRFEDLRQRGHQPAPDLPLTLSI